MTRTTQSPGPAEDYLVLPGAGERSADMLIKLRAHQLGGAFSMMEGRILPKQLLAPHTHDTEDQAVYVIKGTLTFEVGGQGGTVFEVPADSYVRKPRGISHGFWNATDEEAVYIELSSGARFEGFIDAADTHPLAASVTAPVEHGVTFHYDRIPELMRAHGLTKVRGGEGVPEPIMKLIAHLP